MRKTFKLLALFPLTFSVFACGGSGGSSDSGMLIEGTLIEAGGASHASLNLRHSSGEAIETVQICALGKCSTTDEAGQWGFVADKSFNGGDVEFSIDGHGIDTTTVLSIPSNANEVFLDFKHVEGGRVIAEHITVDGVTSHHEEGEEHHN